MVRVVSQNFSPPRSRHSSGETDRDLAERANLALSTLGRKRVETPDCESSSDSFWDSEFDGDHNDTLVSENGENSNDINGNENPEKSDAQIKRKERRRERNKLSAQAYRQRRRHQNVKEQQTLFQLESENKRLHKLVETLEKKTEQAKQYLRGCSVPMPDILHPIGELEGACADVPSDELAECPSPKMNSSSSHTHLTPSNHALTTHGLPLSDPIPAHQSPSSSHTLTCPPVLHDQHPQVPVMMNGNFANTNPYTTATQSSPTPTQFIINANALLGASYSPAEGANPSAVPVPTFLAVPIENQNQCIANSNLNCNPLRTCPPMSHPNTSDAPSSPSNGTGHSTANTASPVIIWNVNTGNQPPSNGNPVGGTIFKLEMCNNNVMNSQNGNNANDANGNSCDRNLNAQGHHPSSQLMSFNQNMNHTGEASHSGHHNGHHQSTAVKHPVSSVQYYLTPSDQAMSVSVQ